MQSKNPVFQTEAFRGGYAGSIGAVDTMTIDGTVNRTGVLVLLAMVTGSITWGQVATGNPAAVGLFWGGLIGGFILAMVTVFKQTWAPYTAPLYAAAEGLFLGGISSMVQQADPRYTGIVFQAILLTFGTLLAMLMLYKSGVIKVTEKFRTGVMTATAGIFVAYLLNFLLSLFGVGLNLWSMGGFGIIISLVVIGVAALNLVLDFDFIERGAAMGLPKYMEWVGAFGLMVTLVWLYIEFLRLLTILQGRD